MKWLKAVSLIVMMALSAGALGTLYIEGKIIHEIITIYDGGIR